MCDRRFPWCQTREAAARIAGIEPGRSPLDTQPCSRKEFKQPFQNPNRGMRAQTPASIPVTEAELGAALAEQTHAGKRKRLLAVQALLRGATKHEAAQLARASSDSVARWLKRASKGGISTVLADKPRKEPMTAEAIAAARADIAAALRRNPNRRLRWRLNAIDAVLAAIGPKRPPN